MGYKPPNRFDFFAYISFVLAIAHLIYDLFFNTDPAATVTTVLTVIIAILLIAIGFTFHAPIADKLQDFDKQLSGPDHAHQNPVWATLQIFAQGIYRFFWRITKNDKLLPSFFTLILTSSGWYGLFLADSYLGSGTSIFTGIYSAAVTIGGLTLGAYIVSRLRLKIYEAQFSSDSYNKTRSEFLDALGYKHFTGTDARKQRAALILEDPGPFIIMSATGSDLLEDPMEEDDEHDVFTRAWEEDRSKRFRIILTDPTIRRIRNRNKHLNGKYLAYYVYPYLRMLSRCNNESRLQLFRSTDLSYRLVMSQDRVFVQRYEKVKHGWEGDAVVLKRVFTIADTEQLFEDFTIPDTLTQFKNLPDTGPLTKEDCSRYILNSFQAFKSSHSERETIYSTYYIKAVKAMAIESAEEESSLDSWDIEKLQLLARYCHIDEKLISHQGDCNSDIAKLIYEHLDRSTKKQ